MPKDLLFELGVEELPSGEVKALGLEIEKNFKEILNVQELSYEEIKVFSTPRRIAVIINNLSDIKPGKKISRRGPPVKGNDKNSKSVTGFASSCNVDVNSITTIKSDKGEWWFFEYFSEDTPTKDFLPDLINTVINDLHVKKPMRWGNAEYEFVRPIHWAVLLFGQDVIKTTILGVESGNKSYGHRFHHPEAIVIESPKDYEKALEHAYVIPDFAKRKSIILKQVQKLAEQKNLSAQINDALVDEVTSIVEWPNALLIEFDKEFLKVPEEALIASITQHQKCFPVKDENSKLAPYFITVANIESIDENFVIKGNQSVMRARLSDAAFFFKQDIHQPLIEYYPKLAKVIYQAALGTLEDKIIRHKNLILHLISSLKLDKTNALRAVELSKCDLVTSMIGEFPELEGYMGEQYALISGESPEVAKALLEQYLPRFADDKLPETRQGIALSIVDRIDTLVGIFAIGKKPTGLKDPFKLRRHALAIVRLLTENPIKINLSTLIAEAFETFGSTIPANAKTNVTELKPFILDRLNAFYMPKDIKSDVVKAVRAKQDDWLYDMHQRIQALNHFQQTKDAYTLSQACKRVNNILQNLDNVVADIDQNKLIEASEKDLFKKMSEVEELLIPLYIENDYKKALKELSKLKNELDSFFDNVMVMVDDKVIQKNRLALLKKLQEILSGVADISLLNINAQSQEVAQEPI